MLSDRFDDCFAYDRALISVCEAVARLKARIDIVAGREKISVLEAAGRFLAVPLKAPRNVPAFDNAAVDGWAVRWVDAMAERSLCLRIQAGCARAGHPFDYAVPAGCALRVLTGAVLPEGVDTVVLQEACRVEDGLLHLPASVKRGANCRPAGEDIAEGETLFSAGHRLRAQDLGAIALMGFAHIEVGAMLKIGLISTGDEVIEPGTPWSQGMVYDANRPMLKALYASLPVEITDLGRLDDDAQKVERRLLDAAYCYDAVITSGGASQGDEDHIARTLTKHGKLYFWRIALKPGRPMAFGQIARCMFIGLPGNPVASFVCSQLFAKPMLNVMGGGVWPDPLRIPVQLASGIKKQPGRTEMVRARLERAKAGLTATKIGKQGSGVLTSLVEADGLLELGHDLVDPKAGDSVLFWPFPAI